MEPIAWSDRFSVGDGEMDGQHQTIIRLINKLVAASGATTDSELLEDILNEMTQYALGHLKHEEDLMREWDYPERVSHSRLHRQFQLEAARFCVQTVNGFASVSDDVLIYLCRWWTDHILEEDMKYRAFIQQPGTNPAAPSESR